MAKFVQVVGFGTPFASLAKDGKLATGSEAVSTLFDPRKLGGGTDMFGALKSDRKVSDASAPTQTEMPQAPKSEMAAEQAQTNIKRRRAVLSKTTYSSPLGLSGQANVTRKTLTGQ